MKTKVGVNNLGAATAETDLPDLLSDLFSSYGKVAEVTVPVDLSNGRMRHHDDA